METEVNLSYPHISALHDQYYWRRSRPHVLTELYRETGLPCGEVAIKLSTIAYDMPNDSTEQSVISRFRTLYS